MIRHFLRLFTIKYRNLGWIIASTSEKYKRTKARIGLVTVINLKIHFNFLLKKCYLNRLGRHIGQRRTSDEQSSGSLPKIHEK